MISISCLESKLLNNNNWYGRFQLAPFRKGEGLTVANALRRTLLADKSNFYITWVDFYNAEIPYSVLTGMRESIFDILLNLKQVIFTSDIIIPNSFFLETKSPSSSGLLTSCTTISKNFLLSDVGSLKFSSYKDYSKQNYETWKKPKQFVGVSPITSPILFQNSYPEKKGHELKRPAESASQNTTKSYKEHRSKLNLPRGYASYLQAWKQTVHGFHGYNNGQDQAYSKSQKIKYWEKKTPIALNNVASLKVKRQIKPLTKSRSQKSITITSIGDPPIASPTLPLFEKKRQTESEPLNVVSDYFDNSDSNQTSDSTYTAYICAKGPTVIYAKNIKLPKGLKCVDPDKYIVTLADDGLFYLRFALTGQIESLHVTKKTNMTSSTSASANINQEYLPPKVHHIASPILSHNIGEGKAPENKEHGLKFTLLGGEAVEPEFLNVWSINRTENEINHISSLPKPLYNNLHYRNKISAPLGNVSKNRPYAKKIFDKEMHSRTLVSEARNNNSRLSLPYNWEGRRVKSTWPFSLQYSPDTFSCIQTQKKIENNRFFSQRNSQADKFSYESFNKAIYPRTYTSEKYPNGYTKDLIEKQYLLYTNDTIKQRNFQTPSILAQIQKTCLLNIQIKHYYYKCGRFDRFLFDLIKPFKPYIKSSSYNPRNLNKGYIYLPADKTHKSFTYHTYCLRRIVPHKEEKISGSFFSSRKDKAGFSNNNLVENTHNGLLNSKILGRPFLGLPGQKGLNSKMHFTLGWNPIQNNRSKNIRFDSLKQSVKKEYFSYFCTFLKPHSSISKNSQEMISFIVSSAYRFIPGKAGILSSFTQRKNSADRLSFRVIDGRVCGYNSIPTKAHFTLGWGSTTYGFTLNGNLKQSNLLNYQLPSIALENIKFINDLSITLLVPDKLMAYKKKNSSSNSFAKRWLIMFFSNTYNYLLSPNSQQTFAYYNMLRDTRLEWQFGTSTSLITKQPIIGPWQIMSGIKCILLQTMRWGSKQLQSLIINVYLKLESLSKTYTENERVEQRNDNDIRSFYRVKTRMNIREKKDLFEDICLFGSHPIAWPFPPMMGKAEPTGNKLLDNFILFSSKIPNNRNNIKWIPDSLSLRSLSKFYFLKEWGSFFPINLNIISKSQTTIKPIPNNSVVLKPIYLNIEQIFYILKQSAKFRKNQRINSSFFDLTHRFRFLSSLTRAYHNGLAMLKIKAWSKSKINRPYLPFQIVSHIPKQPNTSMQSDGVGLKRNSAIIAKKNSLSPKGFLVFQKNDYASKNLLDFNVTKPYFDKNKTWGKRKDSKSTKTTYNNKFTTKYLDKISNLSLNFKINHNSLQVEPFTINIYNSKIAYTLRYIYPFKYTIFETFLQFLFKSGSIPSHKILQASPVNLKFEKQKSKFDLIQYNESFKMYTNLACTRPHPLYSSLKSRPITDGLSSEATTKRREFSNNKLLKNSDLPGVEPHTEPDQKQKGGEASRIVPSQAKFISHWGRLIDESEQQEEKLSPIMDRNSVYSSNGLRSDKKQQTRPMTTSSFNPELNLLSKGAYPAFITSSRFSFSKSNTWFDSSFDYFSEHFQASQKKKNTVLPVGPDYFKTTKSILQPLWSIQGRDLYHKDVSLISTMESVSNSPLKNIVCENIVCSGAQFADSKTWPLNQEPTQLGIAPSPRLGWNYRQNLNLTYNEYYKKKGSMFFGQWYRMLNKKAPYFINDSFHVAFFPNSIPSVNLAKQPSRITQRQVTAEFLPQLKDRFFLQTNNISSSWFHSQASPTYIQSIIPSTFTLERRDYFYSQKFYFQHGNVYNQLSFLPHMRLKKKAYTMAGIGNNLTWSVWNLVCMGQSLNSSFSFLLDKKKKVPSNPAYQGFFGKVNEISTYLPLLEDPLPNKHTGNGFFNAIDSTKEYLSIMEGEKKPRVEEGENTTAVQKYDSTLCFSLSLPIISLLISCSASYFRLFGGSQNNQIPPDPVDRKRLNSKAYFTMGWDQKKKIKPSYIKHLHYVSRISSELSNNDHTSFTCKWRIMNLLNFTDAFITIPYTETFYLQPLHSHYKNATINNYKNILRTNRKMKKNSKAWPENKKISQMFAPFPSKGNIITLAMPNLYTKNVYRSKKLPGFTYRFTPYKAEFFNNKLLKNSRRFVVASLDKTSAMGWYPINRVWLYSYFSAEYWRGKSSVWTYLNEKQSWEGRRVKWTAAKMNFTPGEAEKGPPKIKNFKIKNFRGPFRGSSNSLLLEDTADVSSNFVRTKRRMKSSALLFPAHFTLGLNDREKRKKTEVSLKYKPMNSQETFDSLHQRFKRQIANHFQKFPASKNLAISFENIYYKNVLWNSRKITLRLLTNAILPLVANRKFSVITSIPLKNSTVPIYTKTNAISRVHVKNYGKKKVFSYHHTPSLGLAYNDRRSHFSHSDKRETGEIVSSNRRFEETVFGLSINSKVPRYYTFFGTEPFPFSSYKFSFLLLKTANSNPYPDLSTYVKGVQRVREKCLSSFGIINESFRINSNIKSNTEKLVSKTNTLNPQEILMVRDSALSIINLWFSSFFCMYSLYGISTKSDIFLQNLISLRDWTSSKEDNENNNLHLQADPENNMRQFISQEEKINLSITPSLDLEWNNRQSQTPSFQTVKKSENTDFYGLKRKMYSVGGDKPQDTIREEKLNNKSKNSVFPYQFTTSHRLEWNDQRGLPLFNNESLPLTHSSNYYWRKTAHFVFVRNYKKKDYSLYFSPIREKKTKHSWSGEYWKKEGSIGDFIPGKTMEWYNRVRHLRVKKTEQYMYGGLRSHRILSICDFETIESFQAFPDHYTASHHLEHNSLDSKRSHFLDSEKRETSEMVSSNRRFEETIFGLNQKRTYLSDALLSKNTNMLQIGISSVLRKNKLPLCYQEDKTQQTSFIFLYPLFIQNSDLPWRNLSFFPFFQYEQHYANQSLFFFSSHQRKHVSCLTQPDNPVLYQGPFVSKSIGSHCIQYTFPSHTGRREKCTSPLQYSLENKISRETSWYPTITYTLLSSSSVETSPNKNTDLHIIGKDFSQATPDVLLPSKQLGGIQNNSINWFKGLFLNLQKEQEIGTDLALRQKNNPLWIYENNLLAGESQISRIINLNDEKRKKTKPLTSVQPWEKIKKKDDVGKNISSSIHMDNKKYYGMVGYFSIKESLNSIHKVNYIVESHSIGFQPIPMFEMKQQVTLDSGLTDFQTTRSKSEEEKEYIQIDIWTNGSLSPRQALLNAFKNLFELFYNLSKYNCLKPIEI